MSEYSAEQVALIQEADSLQTVLNSRAFLRLLKTQQEYLQSEVNLYVEKHEDRKAGETLAKVNVYKHLVNLVQNRITELKKQIGE